MAAEERDLEVQLAKRRGKMAPSAKRLFIWPPFRNPICKDAKMRGESTRFLNEFKTMLNKKTLPSLCYAPAVDELTYTEILEFVKRTM
jgi:hypothetical protein